MINSSINIIQKPISQGNSQEVSINPKNALALPKVKEFAKKKFVDQENKEKKSKYLDKKLVGIDYADLDCQSHRVKHNNGDITCVCLPGYSVGFC